MRLRKKILNKSNWFTSSKEVHSAVGVGGGENVTTKDAVRNDLTLSDNPGDEFLTPSANSRAVEKN